MREYPPFHPTLPHLPSKKYSEKCPFQLFKEKTSFWLYFWIWANKKIPLAMSLTVNQLERICIDSCLDCLEACKICAIECKKMSGMESCIKNCEICIQYCENCIVACKSNSPDLEDILEKCISACKDCADECEKYDLDHFQTCVQECKCVEEFTDLFVSVSL
jgi:hypothetical protein